MIIHIMKFTEQNQQKSSDSLTRNSSLQALLIQPTQQNCFRAHPSNVTLTYTLCGNYDQQHSFLPVWQVLRLQITWDVRHLQA